MSTDSLLGTASGALATPAKTAFISLALIAVAVAAAIGFGGPAPIAPLASINAPFAKADFSDLPQPRHFTARDGARLAWLHYPAAGAAAPARRIVMVHGSSARARSMHVLALAQAGFVVAAPDMRGHGDSARHGHADYVGQLEHEVADFMRAVPHAAGGNTLAFAFRPRDDDQADIRNTRHPLRVVAGAQDELFDAGNYAAVIAAAGRSVPVTLVDSVGHIGLTLDARALPAIVAAARG